VAVGAGALGVAAAVTAAVVALGGEPTGTPAADAASSSAGPPSPSVVTAPGGPPGGSASGVAVAPSVTVPGGGGSGPKGDATHPGDGTWGVGPAPANQTVASGTYETTVPADSRDCTYIRVALNHTIISTHHARAGQHVTVTIAPTDGLFNTKGCGEWQRVP